MANHLPWEVHIDPGFEPLLGAVGQCILTLVY